MSAEVLLGRCEDYQEGILPAGVLAVTIGVDVQGGGGTLGERLAISVWGWGRKEEGWLIQYVEIAGDPTRSEVWKRLDEFVMRRWPHELGGSLKADFTAVDSGGLATSEVYQYARERKAHGVIAIKGQEPTGQATNRQGHKSGHQRKRQDVKEGRKSVPCRRSQHQKHDGGPAEIHRAG